MSFDSLENSVHEGSKFELYRFETEDNLHIWTYTTDREQFYLDTKWYVPEAIKRSETSQSTEGGSGQRLTITVPYDNPVAVLHVPYLPPKPVKVTIYSVHRKDAALEVKQVFIGYITSFSQTGPEVAFQVSHIIDSQQRRVPWVVHKPGCVWALYEEGCNVQKSMFETQIETWTASGITVTSVEFSALGADWFRNGYIYNPENGERRFITMHDGDVITLTHPFIGLNPDLPLVAYAGCMRTEDICFGKFNNKANYLGFDHFAEYNVFNGGLR